jgi:hypothetical protein
MKTIAILLVLFTFGCDSPTPTGAVCPDPDPGTLTWESFGEPFMTKYCTSCHDSALPRSKRNGAPLFHDFDTLLGVLKVDDHIDEQSGAGPDATNEFMPPDRCPATPGGSLTTNCPKPTLSERRQLSEWIACEKNRDHTFFDAGVSL